MSEKLGTEAKIGRVDFRLFNHLTIDNVLLYDQQHKEMLRAGRIAAGVELLPLLDGKIRITSAQLFGVKAILYQKGANSPLNCQFVIDSLKNKDTLSHTPLDLAISSLIIRHGTLTYDRNDIPKSHTGFSIHHLAISDISSHIVLNQLTDDTVDVNVKRLSMSESSGLIIKDLSIQCQAAKDNIHLSQFNLLLPSSALSATGNVIKDNKQTKFDTNISGKVVPADLAFLLGALKNEKSPLTIQATAKGTDKKATAKINVESKALGIDLNTDATLYDILDKLHGDININQLRASQGFIHSLSNYGIATPQQVLNLGDVNITAKSHMLSKKHITCSAHIETSLAGNADITGGYDSNKVNANIRTQQLNLARITGENTLGDIACDVNINIANINNLKQSSSISGSINELTYNNYTYRDITLDTKLHGEIISGKINLNDPNCMLNAEGVGNVAQRSILSANVDLHNFSAKRLNLTNAWGDTPLNAHLTITPSTVRMESDIADISLDGHINMMTITQSISNLIASRMPALIDKSNYHTNDNFTINARIKDINHLKQLLPKSMELPEEISINGFLNAASNSADLTIFAPTLILSGEKLQETRLRLFTPDNRLCTTLSTIFMDNHGPVSIELNGSSENNNLVTSLAWDNNRSNTFRGKLNANTRFYTSLRGKTAISMSIPQSSFEIGDSIWNIYADNITMEDDMFSINHFNAGNTSQYMRLNGHLSSNPADSISADLHNVDVAYILNLVNFHSVDFDGKASGHFVVHNALTHPIAHGHLDVTDFEFEHGNMGDLHLDAIYNPDEKKINVDAIADDTRPDGGKTFIKGYISPSPGSLDLHIDAAATRMDFLDSFCGSFLNDINLHASGAVRLFGPFSEINLEGAIKAEGAFTLTSTNCRYVVPGDSVTFIPDDILFHNIPILDKYGNEARLTGGIHHKNLGQLSYDFEAVANKFLAYDIPEMRGDDVFCGRAIINGDIGIHGKGNELLIGANATTLPGTFLTYNASSPDAIRSGDIITWRSANTHKSATNAINDADQQSLEYMAALNSGNERTNIRMAFQVDATPDAKLHVIMDENTGDYIDLFGGGYLRVNYYNKGNLDIFGNYIIDHGTYKMTIQNLLRRDFSFRKGGAITFGGDPYNAILNMQAIYALNSVPLADLNIGSNITANNVPVNCLMNISGTPGKPLVAFGLDLPSLSTDARQMINSVINSEEEMNQQVLYLLAIGRFYAPSSTSVNSETNTTEHVSQSALAVQSFLSGTLSQQFNNVMGNLMQNILGTGNNISFGANIAPGDEGFNNAEYEGLLSGRLFNNRLIFNGQFGYRDNIKTNSQSFIGDFTVQYLLTRNGVLSLKMYNQSNDRYFTRNSLNTQGIGFVIQKEFGK